ncbi:ubiquitin-conjugating enzyme E2 T-like isoform X2 [Asterias amurensis]|uniref:ubiquitin-conjugating enzyme E2 T-like isoform X2 n=1 Tax=Asterias amurensis TaxID=7602 RepID=UPI003AB61BC3
MRRSVMSVRIPKELSRLETDPPPGVSCGIKKDSIQQLQAQIIGADSSPYSDGVFDLEVQIPDNYPMEPPKVWFLTPIYHPNIDTAGRICLDLLKMPPTGGWKPSLSIATLLTSIRLLMSQPNADDPLMADISAEFKTNRALFEQKAKEHTLKHASQQSSACSARQNASSAEHQSNEGDQSESSSDDDSDQSESSSDESISLPDKLAKRKSSQCLDDSMDTKKLRADNP